MCRLWRHVPRWALGGVLYGGLELLWRGYTHWTMLLLAALLCVPLDIANEHMPWDMPLWAQAVIGGLTVTAAELAAGVVLNLLLGLGCGTLRHVGQPLGAGVPAVYGPVVSAGRAGHRGL